ncbi:hypothetical protein WMF17_20725 [Sorangium sp. So ce362]
MTKLAFTRAISAFVISFGIWGRFAPNAFADGASVSHAPSCGAR